MQASATSSHRLTIAVYPNAYAICRLDANAGIPVWAATSMFHSITRTCNELSVVCAESSVPPEIHAERKRRLLKIEGTLAFTLTGILHSIAAPLAEAEISIFAVSTYDTDYILVNDADLERALAELEAAGHTVTRLPNQ